jgi:hypothetical protein
MFGGLLVKHSEIISQDNIVPDLYQVMPDRIQIIVNEHMPSLKYEQQCDLQVVYLYWLWALNHLYIFSQPKTIEYDVESGIRQMLSRMLFNNQQKVSKSQLKIFRKVSYGKRWDLDILSTMSWALKTSEIQKTLQHLKVIFAPLIHAIKDHVDRQPIGLVNSAYVKAVLLDAEKTGDSLAAVEQIYTIDRVVSDTIRMAEQLSSKSQVIEKIIAAKSLNKLTELHDATVILFNEHMPNFAEKNVLPLPPLPGNDHIIPIYSDALLHAEGREMKHCVGSYTGRVRSHEAYIYKVLHPQRATLAINPKTYAIQELQLATNKKPSEATVLAVQQWLNSSVMALADS